MRCGAMPAPDLHWCWIQSLRQGKKLLNLRLDTEPSPKVRVTVDIVWVMFKIRLKLRLG